MVDVLCPHGRLLFVDVYKIDNCDHIVNTILNNFGKKKFTKKSSAEVLSNFSAELHLYKELPYGVAQPWKTLE